MFAAIGDFFAWLYRILVKSLQFAVTGKALLIQAITGLAATVSTMFSRFTWLDTAIQYVNSATETVSSFMQRDFGTLGNVFLGWFAIDRLAQIALTLVTATIGVTVVIFVTVFVSVFAIVPVVLTVRGICKLIKTATVGIADP